VQFPVFTISAYPGRVSAEVVRHPSGVVQQAALVFSTGGSAERHDATIIALVNISLPYTIHPAADIETGTVRLPNAILGPAGIPAYVLNNEFEDIAFWEMEGVVYRMAVSADRLRPVDLRTVTKVVA
jgi:hypothetical protein